MNQLPANTGWLWVKQGFGYFRRRPMEFSSLFLGYLFLMLIVGFVPILGQILAFVFLPLFTLAFMQACRQIDQGKPVHPRLLLYGFRSPQAAKLMQLGVLYLVAAMVALGSSFLIDDGVFWQAITGQIQLNAKTVEDTNMIGAMFFSFLVYIPALIAFWFAGPLIAWQEMPLLKAIFYSFFASVRSWRVFVVYGLSWFVVGGLLPMFFSALIADITGNPNFIILIMMPFSMVLNIILYCSFYPSYVSVFGQPADNAESTMS